MLIRVPDYFGSFRCLAGACPRSCCTGWEVVIDDDTAAAYAALPGPMGEQLRQSLREEDGELCFPLQGGRCPFLDAAGLCRIYRELGEEHLSDTCRLHPRFTEEYGPLRETSLAASCPAVADLLLGSTAPLTFPLSRTAEPEEPGDPWLADLLALRERLLAILQDRAVPLADRMAGMLCLAFEAQLLLDDDRSEELPALCAGDLPAPPAGWDDPAAAALFPRGFRLLQGMELLERDWPALLRAAQDGPAKTSCPDWALERICTYFLFRYVLKAVNDGDLLGQVQLCLFSTAVIRRLSALAAPQEALYRYCREIEHSEENLTALREALGREEELSWLVLLREWKTV